MDKRNRRKFEEDISFFLPDYYSRVFEIDSSKVIIRIRLILPPSKFAQIGQGDSTFELSNCDENIYLHLDVNFVGNKFRIFNESKVKYEVHSFIEDENRRL